jgi:hypothetical protein
MPPAEINMNFVKTPQGPIELVPPEIPQLQALRKLLPLGIVQYGEPVNGAKYGLVMKCGDDEAFAVKQQPVEVPTEHSNTCFTANNILIALSLRKYLESGFAGLMMPCAYMRSKGAKGVEAGIAYFAAPDPGGIEGLDFPHDNAFDNQFGTGFTVMLTGSIRAIQAASKSSGITLQQPIGLDLRPRNALETLGFGFLVHGHLIYCLKTQVREDDPVWTCLRSTGIEHVIHLPSVPAEIALDELPLAKPSTR